MRLGLVLQCCNADALHFETKISVPPATFASRYGVHSKSVVQERGSGTLDLCLWGICGKKIMRPDHPTPVAATLTRVSTCAAQAAGHAHDRDA